MLALHYLINQNHQIDRLLTTVNAHHDRVSMHGLRRDLLIDQSAALGLKLDILEVSENPSMEDYDALMTTKIRELEALGYNQTVYGDIFLEDLKTYREDMLVPFNIAPIFPLWKKDTKSLVLEFIDLGYRAVIVCINNSKLDESFLGETLTTELIDAMPDDVDPCGENGEFHTFCYDGPLFERAVNFQVGDKVFRHYNDPSGKGNEIRFGFCDLRLVTPG